MRTHFSFVILHSSLSAVLALCAMAADDGPSFSAELAVPSAYVWRGLVLNDELTLQPSLTFSSGPLSANLFGVWDLTASNERRNELTEVDATATVSTQWHEWCLEAGVIGYFYPGDDAEEEADSAELFVSLGADILLLPTVSIYYDVDEVQDYYLTLQLSHSFEFAERLNLDASLTLGGAGADSNAYNFDVDEAALTDLSLALALPVAVSEQVEIAPGLAYSRLLPDSLRDAADAMDMATDQLTASLTLSCEF
ncbi:MAG: hypothetical protein JXR37_26010 [Kiritimatiellae bacterium]|nr:hypothetical protein [Kiritimatiellia bacterium]